MQLTLSLTERARLNAAAPTPEDVAREHDASGDRFCVVGRVSHMHHDDRYLSAEKQWECKRCGRRLVFNLG